MALADTARLVASLELQDKFSGTAKKAEAGIGRLESRVNRLGSTASRGLGSLVSNLTKVAAIGAGAAAVGLAASVNAASDLNEEVDKAKVVFGPAADELFRFADAAAAIGLSKAEALGAAGAFGNMFNTIGLAQDESADMSQTMVQLAADMASFNNEDPSDMLDRLRSGLSGEAEPLRRFGVLISEATVKQFAYEEGIAKTGEALTEAQKVQARYGIILRDSAIQQDNFADTSDSLANQQRILSANLRNTASTIGQALLPTVGKLAKAINSLFIDKQPQIERFGKRIGTALESVFTNKNIDEGIATLGGFIDKLAKGGGGDGLKTVSSSIGEIAGSVAGLPWKSIGDAARLLGTGSKALLDAFLGLPPWVQTAVLTGWGLNKLTGGALGTIVGELGKGLIKGVLNMNAGVVNVNAKTVTGVGGGPGGAGGRGGVGGFATGLLGTAGIAAALAGGFSKLNTQEDTVTVGLRDGDISKLAAAVDFSPGALIGRATQDLLVELGVIDDSIKDGDATQVERLEEGNRYAETLNRNTITVAEKARQQRVEGNRYASHLNSIVATVKDQRTQNTRLEEGNRYASTLNSNVIAGRSESRTRLDQIRDSHNAALGTLAQIRDKPSSFTTNVTVNNDLEIGISAAGVAATLTRIALTTNQQQHTTPTVQ